MILRINNFGYEQVINFIYGKKHVYVFRPFHILVLSMFMLVCVRSFVQKRSSNFKTMF